MRLYVNVVETHVMCLLISYNLLELSTGFWLAFTW